jgi:hypothetical protein
MIVGRCGCYHLKTCFQTLVEKRGGLQIILNIDGPTKAAAAAAATRRRTGGTGGMQCINEQRVTDRNGWQLQLCVHHAINGIDEWIVNAVNECAAQVDVDAACCCCCCC